jgi:uncharacterized protein YdhG (YjbR/CyaY superfamily)
MNEIDLYIDSFPDPAREMMRILRKTIQAAAPHAEEVMSYRMPAYKQNGVLLYFAAYKNHIGLYPTASGVEKFKQAFSSYRQSKGTIQFPLDKPLPLELITEVVRFRVEERLKKAALKNKR